MRWILSAAAATLIAAAALATGRAGDVPRARSSGRATEAAARFDLPAPSPRCTSSPTEAADVPADALDPLHAALAARDADGLARAGDDLAAWLAGDEGRALRIVDGLRAETDAVATDLLAMTLASDTGAATWSRVAREMLAIARSDPLAERRRAALLYLARSGARSAEIEADGLWIAQSDSDPLARAAAFDLLGAIASSDAAAAARVHPRLVTEAARASDPAVRIAALQAIDPAHASEDVLRAIRDIGANDLDADVRAEAKAKY